MSISIHHGGNGSYKSAGVTQDYIVPCAITPSKEYPRGRVVVTNLRGMSRERFLEVFGDKILPDFDLVHVDTSTQAGRERVLTWWHWVPLGALLVWDECNMCFPSMLRDAQLQQLAYKTLEEAEADNRPHEWLTAWEQHRHYNWDIVLMCPNIKSVRSDIRQTAEGGYKHVNMALIGIKGRYKEGFHEADNNGTASNITVSKVKKIRKSTFALYDSSKTGMVKDTINGVAFFKSTPLLLGVAVVALSFYYAVSSGGYGYFFEERNTVVPGVGDGLLAAAVPAAAALPGLPAAPPGAVRPGDVVPGQADNADLSHRFLGFSFHIVGYARFGDRRTYHLKLVNAQFEDLDLTTEDLRNLGYQVIPLEPCLAIVRYRDFEETVSCSPILRLREQPAGAAGGRA